MAKLNMKFPRVEHAAAEPERPVHDHVVQVADNAKLRAISPVSDVAPEDAIVRAEPQVASEVAPPPIAAENTSVVAKTPPVIQAAPIRNPFTANDPEPAPAVTASLMPPAPPEVAEERPLLSAPMVFEAPKPADAQVLTALPKTEVIAAAPPSAAALEAPKQVEKPVPAVAPVRQASLAAEPAASEFPKSVMIVLPLPKPPLSPAQRLPARNTTRPRSASRRRSISRRATSRRAASRRWRRWC